eukprot:TRINITY_DN12019_c0_g1_i1.p2 TRINITY_DN12019_c0_g1~~TRINITY_DN12019_c0_g1_i1.p2  ORF type:complete len:347 (+),score=101.58 TRINITY_DN12019_c0_g1_i1:1778-2818(+)
MTDIENEEVEGGWAVGSKGDLVVATQDRNILYGSVKDEVLKLKVHDGKPVRCLEFLEVGGKVAVVFTAGDDKVVEARDVDMKVVHKSDLLPKKVGQLKLSGKNTILVADKTGEVVEMEYSVEKGFGPAKFLLGHTASMVTGMEVCYKGLLVATTDKDEHLRLSRYPEARIIEKMCFGHQGFISGMVKVTDTILATGGGDGMVRFWSLPGGESLAHDQFEGSTVHCLATTTVDGKPTVLASVEGVGVVSYTAPAFTRGPTLSPRAPTAMTASATTLYSAFIGNEPPYLQRATIAPTTLAQTPLSFPVEIVSVKPSYWQVELNKRRSFRAGEEPQRKKLAKTDAIAEK